ncbi:chorismate mutase [Acidocella sp.]|uniref:chorismate mutase n=1 Tax=Acidocella sp. TaxID=50710 RepID=UPI00262EDA4A|nr:chorismate mutase [Acidocella sp.]
MKPPFSSHRLAELRAKLDNIDDQILELFAQRAGIVGLVASEGGKVGVKIRPGREADIVRRLLGQLTGDFPRQAVVRIWREVFAAALIIEGGQKLSVLGGPGGETRLALAREHFGPLTPVRHHARLQDTLDDLQNGRAQVAVLPDLAERHEPWWPAHLLEGAQRLYVIGKIPFWAPRAEGLPAGLAYLVATVPPDASTHDHSLIGISSPQPLTPVEVQMAMTRAGYQPTQIWVAPPAHPGGLCAIAEIPGFATTAPATGQDGQPLDVTLTVLGCFALPVGDA